MAALLSRFTRWLDATKAQLPYQLFQSGRVQHAEELCRDRIAADPNNADAHHVLGMIALKRSDGRTAIEHISRAIELNGSQPAFHNSIGMAFCSVGDLPAAIRSFQQALGLGARNPAALNNLGTCYKDQRHFADAVECYRRAIAISPQYAAAYANMADALISQNDLDGAIAGFRKAMALDPNLVDADSSLLFVLNYRSTSQRDLYQEAVEFDMRHVRRLLKRPAAFDNTRDKNRVLKIGYVSPDFREHSVAHFTQKLIAAHHRDRVEVYCYSNVAHPDDLTPRFQATADHWRTIAGMPDEDVAKRIRNDHIDILVDLAGHSASNRLLVLGRRPAPIQVTWLGYPNTTGVRTIDYRLTDAVADPPGDADQLHTEKLIRLEHGFLCYQRDDPLPEVSAPPCLQQRHVTFGSFNAMPKTTPEVVRVWSQILRRVEGARLVLKSSALVDDTARANMRRLFGQYDIGPDRLDLIAWLPERDAHMQLYSRIDIALDPFPYNGTTTTCEALWMGVPVITLSGDRHAGRVGTSILRQVGLPELVAESEDEYVNLAHKLASDTGRLDALRGGLRTQMLRSVLMDVQLFTDTLESAYREMWVKWCDRQGISV